MARRRSPGCGQTPLPVQNQGMPWGFLARLLTAFLLHRLRGARGRHAVGPAFRAAAAGSPVLQQRLRNARELAALLWRLILTVGFGVATGLLVAAGTSTTVLSPRWLGIVLLIVAVPFAVLTIREARGARALVQVRRLRRRDQRVRAEL